MTIAQQLHCFDSSGRPAYHNTLPEPEAQRRHYERVAQAQDEAVLSFFDANKAGSPSQALRWLISRQAIGAGTPLTSIRRSITNLTRKGKLLKMRAQVDGPYGRKEGTWRRV